MTRETIIDRDEHLAENKRLIAHLWSVDKTEEFANGYEFTLQYLFFKDDKWIQIARIDNQLHEGKPGTHIHIYGKKQIKWEELSFNEAEEKIVEIAKNIINLLSRM